MTGDEFMQTTIRPKRWQYITVAAAWLFTFCLGLGACMLTSGCSTIQNTPVIGDIVPDLTDPAELRDAAELAGALVLQNNPKHVAAIGDAVQRAQQALEGEGIVTREMFDGWIADLLDKTIDDPVVRIFVRQRFDRAWEHNSHLLDVSGLLLNNPKHRELAEAFVAGLASAAEQFSAAQTLAKN